MAPRLLISDSQLALFPDAFAEPLVTDAASSTFTDNMRLPVHRWFRFSAGFSAVWAQHEIEAARAKGEVRVFDPFAGSGTTLIAAEDACAPSYGVEAQPFIFRIAQAKLARRTSRTAFERVTEAIQQRAKIVEGSVENYPKLIRSCYSDAVLTELDRLRTSAAMEDDGSDAARLSWLNLAGILRRCSHVGTAQWQYILPKKTKKSPVPPFVAFDQLNRAMLADMRVSPAAEAPAARLVAGDARDCAGIPTSFATLVITSPPYPNNYDYADATRLEMSFFQEITGWGDLQTKVRRHLVRACSQHVPEKSVQLEAVLHDPILEPIRPEIETICNELAKIRLTKGGKKTYHLMIACYFHDLARVWHSLRRVCDSPSQVCLVIGDSAPYGVYVPVIDWLMRLAVSAGFHAPRFERTRERNIKWKNRKHRVPLCEGRLWVEG